MEWTNELTLKFLELFENEPVIWNPRIPDHKNRNKVADAWINIQRQLSVDCSVTELKKKKESLMAMFRQLLNKRLLIKDTIFSFHDSFVLFL